MCVVGSGSRRWSRGSSRIRIRAMPPPSESHYLLTGVNISAWIRLATVLLAGLTWIPGASRAPRGLHLPETDRWLALACAAGGTTRWAAGRGQSHATAVMTAVAGRAAIGLPAAVHHLHTVLTIADVPAGRGIELATAG